jgi:hypothetical protein
LVESKLVSSNATDFSVPVKLGYEDKRCGRKVGPEAMI